MPQSLAQLYTHLIFSTKNRVPMISNEIQEDLRAYLGGILRELNSPAITAGVVKDHVHLLYRHSKNISLAKLVEEVKKSSSKWIKTKGNTYNKFFWQNGYGAFSVSASKLDAVTHYIQNQEDHHRVVTFQDEFRRF